MGENFKAPTVSNIGCGLRAARRAAQLYEQRRVLLVPI